MEQNLVSDFNETLKTQTTPSLKPFSIARSLIINPATTDQTISTIIQTLTSNPQSHLHHIITLLTEISTIRPQLSPTVTTALHSLLPHAPPRAAALTLSLSTLSEHSEGLFLSLCFGSSVAVRQRLLPEAEKFNVWPSVLLTVYLGFTKDPYPYVRKAALDGLIRLCDQVVAEDRGVIEGCYLRGVDLLSDADECVRCSAVNMVSEWGKLLVENSDDESKRDLSDALYVQLCSMVRDMSMKVRMEAFNALGKAGKVSQYLLMQTLSKRVLEENKFNGQPSVKHLRLRALTAAGAFLHGLEDEFYEVRSSACYSLRIPAILCGDLAEKVLGLLMDVLNDDSTVVRLKALETMHHMAVFGHLKVQDMHMHMFLGTLVDMNSSVRFTARKVLRLTKFDKMPMFKLAADSLINSLEIYPQDEPDVLSVIFEIGRNHGNFAVSITEETFLEMEPCSASDWDFNSSKTASMITLAISAPLSHERQHFHIIPSTIFSYAATMLGRISNGLTEVMDWATLLSYLSHCSMSTGPHHIEIEDDVATEVSGQISVSRVVDPLELHDKEYNCVKFVLANVAEIWQPLMKLGCISELLTALRRWKEELAAHITDSRQSDSVLTFTLQYLDAIKLLSKAWCHVMCPLDFMYNEVGDLGYILQKLDTKLKELRYRFIGLSEEGEQHIIELALVACTLKLSTFDPRIHELALKKLLAYKETSMEPSRFLTELMKTLQKDESDIFSFREPLKLFSLTQLVSSRELRYMRAELEIDDNAWLKPVPFVAGLPAGIPLKMKLHNTPFDAKLWLTMSRSKDAVDYVFIDLKEFEGCDEMREFRVIAPFYKTPKVDSFVLLLCIGIECEEVSCIRGHGYGGPNHDLVYLCKEKQVFLSKGKQY
ncbi:protein SIEL-like [Bidens hawaiensis]|uniref:protein SIEL-like n=1 Tax=Bidens hawaiensis TaxID=980011 RepID=UPI004049CAC3